MREILFRGKRTDGKGWMYGYYSFNQTTNIHWIRTPRTTYWDEDMVDPSTVGQYTGLKDKDGKRIFEGDIIDCWSEGVNAKGTVKQRIDGLWIIYPAWQNCIMWGICPDKSGNTTVEVIGNIYDNPEMRKEGAE